MFRMKTLALSAALVGGIALAGAAQADSAKPMAGANDNLNATYWMQKSVEYKASTMAAYALAKLRLDQALADKSWTAVSEPGNGYKDLPPAVILDVDETVLDNSDYQAWMVATGNHFSGKTWDAYVKTETSRVIPGSLDFITYAASKGVTVYYVSNRTGNLEEATRKNLKALGYPIEEAYDTVLLKKEKEEWKSSKKGVRRAHVAKDHRVLLLIGDNLGDFVDGYKGDRAKEYSSNKSHWGKDWIMLPNPTYGSWEAASFGFDYKKPDDQKRSEKTNKLSIWKQ